MNFSTVPDVKLSLFAGMRRKQKHDNTVCANDSNVNYSANIFLIIRQIPSLIKVQFFRRINPSCVILINAKQTHVYGISFFSGTRFLVIVIVIVMQALFRSDLKRQSNFNKVVEKSRPVVVKTAPFKRAIFRDLKYIMYIFSACQGYPHIWAIKDR